MDVSFQKFKLAKEFFFSLARLGRVVKPLWLKTAPLTRMCLKLNEKCFPSMAAVSELQFQPSATTTVRGSFLAIDDDRGPPIGQCWATVVEGSLHHKGQHRKRQDPRV